MNFRSICRWLPSASVVLCVGCADCERSAQSSATTGWAQEWASLTPQWRGQADDSAGGDRTRVLATGLKGYRFGSAEAWIFVTQPMVSAAAKTTGWTRVFWKADPERLGGVLYRNGDTWVLALKTSRDTLRLGAETELFLVDANGKLVAQTPRLGRVFNLDTEASSYLGGGAHDVRCVAAEASVLARHEIERIAQDAREGRVNNAEASALVEKLSPLLAQPSPLCI